MCFSTTYVPRDVKGSSMSLLGITGMEQWMKISLVLCMFGLLKEFRPSEPFITDYLMSPPMNFTEQQVSQDVYPVSTYANLVAIVIVFLVTDYMRYKIVIIATTLCGFFVYIILIFGRGIRIIQFMECLYGAFMAGEVSYYSYIYAKVDKEHFHKVTSHTRTAYLVGRAISGIVSQVIVSAKLLSYLHLQMLTAGGLALGIIWAIFLPPVETSMYFHRNKGLSSSTSTMEQKPTIIGVFLVMLNDLKYAFSKLYTVNLMIWSFVATAGFYIVVSYNQLLWEVILKENHQSEGKEALWNGGVETCYTILGALTTFSIGKLNLEWRSFSEVILVVNAILMAGVLLAMSQARVLWFCYVCYIVFTIFYQATITIVNAEIARNIKEDSYGLVFGVVMFFSLIAQSLVTVIFIDNTGLGLPPRSQFIVYSSYFLTLGVVVCIKLLISTILKKCGYGGEDSFTVTNN